MYHHSQRFIDGGTYAPPYMLLFVLGTSINGLGLDQSNMDLRKCGRSRDHTVKVKRSFFYALSDARNAERLQRPILTFLDRQSGVKCDLGVNNANAFDDGRLVEKVGMDTQLPWDEMSSASRSTLGGLFVSFIAYYATFTFGQWIISIRCGRPLPIDVARCPPSDPHAKCCPAGAEAYGFSLGVVFIVFHHFEVRLRHQGRRRWFIFCFFNSRPVKSFETSCRFDVLFTSLSHVQVIASFLQSS
ncbi:hypothetical protein TSMEX_011107 [Taenia solium]|eukprot:TsM_000425300 transcript=TsM_000425300 gene=TsM_000425300